MEVAAINNLSSFSTSATGILKNEEPRAHAFGITFGNSNANKPEVELSAQARILQQNEQTQNTRNQSINNQREKNESEAISGNEYIRVSSSVGSAARNNLTSEKATEVYRSIQELL